MSSTELLNGGPAKMQGDSIASSSALLPMTGIILCGGRSKRMGRQKAFLPFAGKTLIEHMHDLMAELFAEVILVSNNPDEYEHISSNLVRDIIPNRGPLVGILSGLLVSNYNRAFVVPCDMPFVDKHLVRKMAMHKCDSDMLIYSHAGRNEPLLGIYSRNCISALEEAIFEGNDLAQDFISTSRADLFVFPTERGANAAHFNVDTPADYGKLCGIA
ncbi:MAG: molybdenum cofactor guanylyltransferase [Candidatus Obscuribacterales bacterium]|nr:molybdenum cofactor guanylyltransferase [Candidatus Obscuribacterales bacterium]